MRILSEQVSQILLSETFPHVTQTRLPGSGEAFVRFAGVILFAHTLHA
jgi:hypothetical protein